MPLVLTILKSWKLVLFLGLAAVIGYLWLAKGWADNRADIAEADARLSRIALDAAVSVNQHNVAEMARWREEAERASQAAAEAQRLSDSRAVQLRAIRSEIVADVSESCPVAPVLLRTLDGLRSLRTPAEGGDESSGGADIAPGLPAELSE